jgi:hypothetical protein
MPINFAVFQKRYEESQQRPTGGGQDYWKPTAAALNQVPHRNVFRLAVPHPNMVVRNDAGESEDPIVTTKIHYGLGPKQDTACPCLEFFGQPCDACTWVDELFRRSKSDPRVKDTAFRIRAKLQFYSQGVDIREPGKGVQTWRFGPDLEKRIRACFYDNQIPPQPRDITDPVTGRNVIIDAGTKPGRNAGETFPSYETVKADDVAQPWDPAWGEPRDLTQELYQPTPAQVQAALQGQRVTRTGSATLISTPSPARLGPVPGSAPVNITPPGAAPGVPYVPPGAPAVTPAPAQAFAPPPPPAAAPAPLVPPASVPPSPAVPPPAPPPAPGKPGPKKGTKVAGKGSAADAVPADPLDLAEAEVRRLGAPIGFTTPIRLTREEIDFNDLPSCYGREGAEGQDVADPNCQICPAIVWCRAVIMRLIPAAA